ncbi:hypothetical protein E2C01_037935 [Portunus trituberculatus]|uniref:Uncharacterized protein n=1 Tax=Portunus trituberculatus TaxID=210409 RepID=A0A5B7FFX5_PORTR|nr:hypothetical protein [Portunus trituberculatus]
MTHTHREALRQGRLAPPLSPWQEDRRVSISLAAWTPRARPEKHKSIILWEEAWPAHPHVTSAARLT